MATNVNAAFDEFMRDIVNLDPDETSKARASRDWLSARLRELPVAYSDFPRAYEEQDLYHGSFHRRTKLRPLDDIDLISCISAQSSTYTTSGSQVRLRVPQESSQLLALCHDNTDELNSKKVINQYVKRLASISQYRKAEIGRNGEAAVLSLESYPWSFDIVPAMFTKPESDGRTYYLIPDGAGHWKKTDPRIDQERITAVNQAHDGHVLPAIRLLKYWNRRQTKPIIQSYVFESMVLSHYEARTNKTLAYVDCEVAPVLESVAAAVFLTIPDPARIQGDLNHIPLSDRFAVHERASSDAKKARQARIAESEGKHVISIRLWSEIFGPEFPSYG